tara:strand:+ start:28678 stop:29397 length:720 start_codon:yes stop_codon:yes gene_type:complete
MRAFDLVQNFLTLLVIPFLATVVGVAAIPAVWFFLEVRAILVNESEFIELIGTGIILGMSSMMWGISLVLLCGFLGGAFRPRLETGRYPLRSFVTIQWAWSMVFHRIAQLFLHVLVPSFIGTLYYRMAGAKIGSGCQLNTPNLNDAGSVILGNRVVLGGNATINAHLTEKGELVMAPVTIGDDALIGTGAVVQPGCNIGIGTVIASRAVVAKWTDVPDGEVWGGIPAKRIRLADGSKPD